MPTQVDKEVCFSHDAPANMSKVLSQELFQSMVTGETMSVPVKCKAAVNGSWCVPVMMASNKRLDYNDEEGQISRRVVTFEFSNFVAKKDPQLERRMCSELPSLVAKSVGMYLQKARDFGDQVCAGRWGGGGRGRRKGGRGWGGGGEREGEGERGWFKG